MNIHVDCPWCGLHLPVPFGRVVEMNGQTEQMFSGYHLCSTDDASVRFEVYRVLGER